MASPPQSRVAALRSAHSRCAKLSPRQKLTMKAALQILLELRSWHEWNLLLARRGWRAVSLAPQGAIPALPLFYPRSGTIVRQRRLRRKGVTDGNGAKKARARYSCTKARLSTGAE